MSYNNNPPRWTQSIRSGDFDAAEDQLAQATAQRLIPHVISAQINSEMERINAESGPYTKYVANEATQRTMEAVQRGSITTPQQFVQQYEHNLLAEVETFRNTVRPGEARSIYSPGIPSDDSVAAYCRSRREEQEHLKEEGRRVSSLPLR